MENKRTFLRNKPLFLENKGSLLENKRADPGNKRALLENKVAILENKRSINSANKRGPLLGSKRAHWFKDKDTLNVASQNKVSKNFPGALFPHESEGKISWPLNSLKYPSSVSKNICVFYEWMITRSSSLKIFGWLFASKHYASSPRFSER